MAVIETKTITAFIGSGITATFTNQISGPVFGYYLDIIWANNESALDYAVEIDLDAAKSLMRALQIIIEEIGEN